MFPSSGDSRDNKIMELHTLLSFVRESERVSSISVELDRL